MSVTDRRQRRNRRREVRYAGSLACRPQLDWKPSEWGDVSDFGFFATVPSESDLTISVERRKWPAGRGEFYATLHGEDANEFVGRHEDCFAEGSLIACLLSAEDYVRRILRAEARQGRLFEQGKCL